MNAVLVTESIFIHILILYHITQDVHKRKPLRELYQKIDSKDCVYIFREKNINHLSFRAIQSHRGLHDHHADGNTIDAPVFDRSAAV